MERSDRLLKSNIDFRDYKAVSNPAFREQYSSSKITYPDSPVVTVFSLMCDPIEHARQDYNPDLRLERQIIQKRGGNHTRTDIILLRRSNLNTAERVKLRVYDSPTTTSKALSIQLGISEFNVEYGVDNRLERFSHRPVKRREPETAEERLKEGVGRFASEQPRVNLQEVIKLFQSHKKTGLGDFQDYTKSVEVDLLEERICIWEEAMPIIDIINFLGDILYPTVAAPEFGLTPKEAEELTDLLLPKSIEYLPFDFHTLSKNERVDEAMQALATTFSSIRYQAVRKLESSYEHYVEVKASDDDPQKYSLELRDCDQNALYANCELEEKRFFNFDGSRYLLSRKGKNNLYFVATRSRLSAPMFMVTFPQTVDAEKFFRRMTSPSHTGWESATKLIKTKYDKSSQLQRLRDILKGRFRS